MSDQPVNLFLSEFEKWPWLSARLSTRWGVLPLCALLLAWSVIAVLLGAYSGANCIKLTMTYAGNTATLLFGYLTELNHGPFNLLGLPVFIFLAHGTLEAAEAGFTQLKSARRLTLNGSATEAFDWIKSKNRSVFRAWFWISVVLAVLSVVPAEISSYNKAHFGWVQSGFANDWKMTSLKNLGRTEVPYAVTESFGLTNAAIARQELGNITISGVQGGTQTKRDFQFLPFFLFVALGLQISYFVIGFWVIGKLVFILYLLFQGFKNADQKSEGKLRLNLYFQDKSRRFGLRALDTVYDQGLAMVTVGSLAFTLQQLSNAGKGTSFGVFERAPFYGHLITLGLAFAVFSVVLIFPGIVFMRHAKAAKDIECNRLETKLAGLREKHAKTKGRAAEEIKGEIDSVSDDLSLAHEQTPWPADDWWFRSFVVLIFSFLILIPLGLLNAAGDWAKPVMDFFAHELPAMLYKLEIALEKLLPWLNIHTMP